MARKLWRTASRSTRATVGRITLLRSVREVLEPGVFLDERELGGADRPVALLADDDLGGALGILRDIAVGVAILLLAIDEHDDVGVLLEGAGLAQVGELRP